MQSVKAATYLIIFLYWIRKIHYKLVESYELDIPLVSNDGEGCFVVIVGECPVYATYRKGVARELAVDIKKAFPRASVSIIEDETIDNDPSLEGTGMSSFELNQLSGILSEFYSRY
jgi:hypothetical protein